MFLKNNLITFLLYFLTTLFVIQIMSDQTQTTLIWPVAGIGVITALVYGYQVLPGLFLAQLAVSLFLDYNANREFTLDEFYISNLFSLGGLVRAYLGAFIIKYFVSYPNSLTTLKSILKFFLIAGPLATLVSTIVYEILKYFLGFIDHIGFSNNMLNWWFGDLMGFIIFSPIALIFISQPRSIWRHRLPTVGIPIIAILISAVLIFNKSQEIDSKRIFDNLTLKTNLMASKIEQNNDWFENLKVNIYSHFLANRTEKKALEYFFNSLIDKIDANAIVWNLNGNYHYIKTSSKYQTEQFEAWKRFNFNAVFSGAKTKLDSTSSTHYSSELKSIINATDFRKNKTQQTLSVYVIHDPSSIINELSKQLGLTNTKISIDFNNKLNPVIFNTATTNFPKENLYFESDVKFSNDTWTIKVEPTASYIFLHKSNLSLILGKIVLICVGFIGVMLLIITGKTALTDIKVKERTLRLDTQSLDLKDKQNQYQNLLEHHPVVLWSQNVNENKITYISQKVVDLFGYSLNKWMNDENFWLDHIHNDDVFNVKKAIENGLQNNIDFELEYRFIKSDTSIAWIKDVVNINTDSDSNKVMVGLMIDVSETQEAKQGQFISESKYKTLFKHSSDPLIIIDLDDNSFKESNEKAIDLFGLDNTCGHITLGDFAPLKQPDGGNSRKGFRKIFNSLHNNVPINFEWTMQDKNHKQIICSIELIKLPQGDTNTALANINDITDSKEHQRKISQLAYYDNLTKLPNREYFYSKFEFFHSRALQKHLYGAIIYLDLDRFKILNDSLGHQAGDELLKIVAKRIKDSTTKNEFCARLGGDEFIILNRKLDSSIESALENSLVKAELISEALNEPYQLGDYEHYITPSIGISSFPFNNATTDQVLHQADIAMYASKAKGKNAITIYQENMVKNVGQRLRVEKAIKLAFSENEFELHYQPQVNENGKIYSVEALLRWNKLKKFKINTENLIDIVDQIGLTHELGNWVLDMSCSQLEKWLKQGHEISSISINISAKQFHQKRFFDQIRSVIESYEISPSHIMLEVTEAVIIDDMASIIEKLSELKEYGVRTSLDDFGTGYSSLAYLKHLPLDQLKIDKLFIHDLSHDKTSQTIIKTIIDLATSLKLELVAEGIEIEEQFAILKQLGCKRFQGFYFSKALGADEIFK